MRTTGGRRRGVAAACAFLLTVTGVVTASAAPAVAACAPNPVYCENQLAGAPRSAWDVDTRDAGDQGLQGFATDLSVQPGRTVGFKVSAKSSFTIDIYRLGYYGGNGARKWGSVPGPFPRQNRQILPDDPNTTDDDDPNDRDVAANCVTQNDTNLVDCGTWQQSTSWQVPATAVSGVYLAVLRFAGESDPASHIPFVVRDDASTSKILFKTSDATWQAYNLYGGADFYSGNGNGRATKISYNRPFATRGAQGGRDFLFSNEYPMIRFLEQNGYDVSYLTDVDADRGGGVIENHKVFLSVGHDEYWSGRERAAVEAARDAGTSLAFFSGNEVYWRTRWEDAKDGSGASHRTLVCYKETWANEKSDPTPEWTGTWRDPRWSPPSNGGRPENGLTGTMFVANSVDLAIQVPGAQGHSRLWRWTDLATQADGATWTAPPHTVGYESDEDLDNGFRPAGLIRLSTTVGPTPQYLRDFGNDVVEGTTTHHLTLYKAPSGALVFGAGTVQWAWGLDANHDSEFVRQPGEDESSGKPAQPDPPSRPMQQATVNLLADMGVQPTSLMTGLHPTAASTDTVGPAVTIAAPAAGAAAANGTQVTVTGTATDPGGQVAGVEVSTDAGASWHPAEGTTAWTYRYLATGDGASTVRVRGIDDSANIGTPTSRQFALTGSTSLFGDRVPANPATGDSGGVELGVKVVPQTDGYVQGVRFYQGPGNTGVHKGSLWSADGDLLATGTFTGESGSGWQSLTFSPPVAVVAGTTYVASYTAPNGHYAADPWAFAYSGFSAPPLSAPRTYESGGNGVHGAAGRFPSSSYQAANYYVDVLFDSARTTPPNVTSTSPAPNALYQPVSTHPTATFNKPVNPSTLQFTLADGGAAVPGSAFYDTTTRVATFTPAAALAAGRTFTATVRAADTNGNQMATPQTWTFTTDPDNTTINRLFAVNASPTVAASGDSEAVTLGVRFTPSSDGSVIGIRYYKGSGNGGTHTGSLWSSAGTRLAGATFVGETTSGWQTVYFPQAVPVTAGTSYVASYYSPIGHYSANNGFFANPWSNGPLSAPSGANGLYRYGSDDFPTSSYGSTNYWVDPLFIAAPQAAQPQLPPGAATVFAPTVTPTNPNWNDPLAIEVGAALTADVAGQVRGVRFYKGTDNTGTHTGSLWSSTGTQLATGVFVGETASGWQTMLFTTPVAVSPGQTYVVSYSTTTGHYAVDLGGLASGAGGGPLRIPAGGGRYKYGAGFPSNAAGHNFWVDAVFTPNTG
jgi:hypothetical protein